MGVSQANERVKEAPAHALRAMFAGIGRLLSVTDKIRNRPGSAGAPSGPRPSARRAGRAEAGGAAESSAGGNGVPGDAKGGCGGCGAPAAG